MLMIRQRLPSLHIISHTCSVFKESAFFSTAQCLQRTRITKEVNSLLMNLNSREDLITKYKEFGKKLTPSELRTLSAQILDGYVPCGSANDEILGLALIPFIDDEISSDLINDTLNMVVKFSKTGSFPDNLQRGLTRRLLKINVANPTFLARFERAIEGYENKENRGMLTSLYLQKGQLEQAYNLIISNIKAPNKLRISSIELVIHHLCHREDIERASNLVELSLDNGYQPYSRTLSAFLTKAIQLGNVEVCYKHYYDIIRKTYIDNGSLMNLIELVSTVGYVREVKQLYKYLLNKTGKVPAEFVRRYNRSLVEVLSRVRGFKRGFRLLEEHPPRSLKVSDYPQLAMKVTASAKLRKIEFTLLKRMNYPRMTIGLKKFYVNLIISKLVERGDIEKALEVLKVHLKVRRYMDEDTISYITRGLGSPPSLIALESLFEVLEKSPLKLRHRRVIDPLLTVIIGSDYWFKVFPLVLERIQIEDYKLPRELAVTLKQKCEEFGYTKHENYM